MKEYDKNSTIDEILEDGEILKYFKFFYSETLLSMIPVENRTHTLAEMEKEVKFPWNKPFDADQLLRAVELAQKVAYTDEYESIILWENRTEKKIPDVSHNDKTSTFLLKRKLNAQKEVQKLPAVIICPGGGYEILSFDIEGIDVAREMEKRGYRAFILNYRLSPNRYPSQQFDLMLAIKYLRVHAEELGIDPNQITTMGASAGGHLCASEALLCKELEDGFDGEIRKTFSNGEEKIIGQSALPDAICLSYPVISFGREAHEGSFQALTGGDESLREMLSVEKSVDSGYPRTFVWACSDDALVPVSNAVRMSEALERAGVDHVLRIYPQGDHGCGIGVGTSAEGWMDELDHFLRKEM